MTPQLCKVDSYAVLLLVESYKKVELSSAPEFKKENKWSRLNCEKILLTCMQREITLRDSLEKLLSTKQGHYIFEVGAEYL